MSDFSTRSRNSSRPRGRRRSSVMALLLRACTVQKTWCPSSSAWPQVRSGSGAPGGSTLMTSAPMSPSSRPANGPAIKVPSSSTRMPSSGPGFAAHSRAREVVADQPVGDDVDGLAQLVALVGARVIVCGAGDFVHLLVGVPDRLEEPSGVAGRAGVVGQVTDHQRRDRDVAPAGHPVAAGVVVAPLRQPAAQRAEAGQPDRAHVHHLRITQVAGSRGAFVGIDGRVQPSRVGHGAVHDEPELVVRAASSLQFGELVLHPRGDAAVAVDLRLPVAGQKLLAVGRLVGVVRVVQIQLGIALGRDRIRRGSTRPAIRSACRAG